MIIIMQFLYLRSTLPSPVNTAEDSRSSNRKVSGSSPVRSGRSGRGIGCLAAAAPVLVRWRVQEDEGHYVNVPHAVDA